MEGGRLSTALLRPLAIYITIKGEEGFKWLMVVANQTGKKYRKSASIYVKELLKTLEP